MTVVSDDFRITVDFDDEADGADLLERLDARRFAAEERRRFGDRVIVSRDAARVFLYAGSEAQTSAVERHVHVELEEQGDDALVAVERWHPVEEAWVDISVPLPATAAELAAEEARREAREEAEALASGHADWEVRVELPGHAECVALAERLESEGVPVVRRHSFLLVGAISEEQARELAERLRRELPAATVHVQPGGDMVWEVAPQNPFAILGGLGG
ncbi:MAG: hypothetical protein KJ051_05255 [Thermoleophilia bacterium]|nr:hypothetical protein [Thermoleophilia bacterium]